MPPSQPHREPPEQPQQKFSALAALHNGKIPLTICIIALLIQLGGAEASEWLRYDRNGILSGEVWRIITGHFTHLGWPHLLMNIVGLLLIWLLFGRLIKPSSWLLILFMSTILTSISMLLLNPELQWYVGLSGVLHGMFVAGAVASIKAGYRAELLLLILLAGKLAWEQFVGPLPGSAEFAGGNVIVDAHLYGAISGLIVVTALFIAASRSKGGHLDS